MNLWNLLRNPELFELTTSTQLGGLEHGPEKPARESSQQDLDRLPIGTFFASRLIFISSIWWKVFLCSIHCQSCMTGNAWLPLWLYKRAILHPLRFCFSIFEVKWFFSERWLNTIESMQIESRVRRTLSENILRHKIWNSSNNFSSNNFWTVKEDGNERVWS